MIVTRVDDDYYVRHMCDPSNARRRIPDHAMIYGAGWFVYDGAYRRLSVKLRLAPVRGYHIYEEIVDNATFAVTSRLHEIGYCEMTDVCFISMVPAGDVMKGAIYVYGSNTAHVRVITYNGKNVNTLNTYAAQMSPHSSRCILVAHDPSSGSLFVYNYVGGSLCNVVTGHTYFVGELTVLEIAVINGILHVFGISHVKMLDAHTGEVISSTISDNNMMCVQKILVGDHLIARVYHKECKMSPDHWHTTTYINVKDTRTGDTYDVCQLDCDESFISLTPAF